MMEAEISLSMGVDQSVLLITEVFPHMLTSHVIFLILSLIIYLLMLNTFFLFLQALQKICLANHIQGLAELLHADTIQQLEVVLLGSPVAHLIDFLSAGLKSTDPTPQPQVVHHPHSSTTIPMSPLPSIILSVGVNDVPSTSRTMVTSSGSERTTPPLQHHQSTIEFSQHPYHNLK